MDANTHDYDAGYEKRKIDQEYRKVLASTLTKIDKNFINLFKKINSLEINNKIINNKIYKKRKRK